MCVCAVLQNPSYTEPSARVVNHYEYTNFSQGESQHSCTLTVIECLLHSIFYMWFLHCIRGDSRKSNMVVLLINSIVARCA